LTPTVLQDVKTARTIRKIMFRTRKRFFQHPVRQTPLFGLELSGKDRKFFQ